MLSQFLFHHVKMECSVLKRFLVMVVLRKNDCNFAMCFGGEILSMHAGLGFIKARAANAR